MEPKIAKDAAELEFARFVDAMGVEADESDFTDEDRKEFAAIKKRVVARIMDGSLVIQETGVPEYTPRRSKGIEALVFDEPTGANLMETDGIKQGSDVRKMNALLASITKKPASVFAKMTFSDYKVCTNIVQLYLG